MKLPGMNSMKHVCFFFEKQQQQKVGFKSRQLIVSLEKIGDDKFAASSNHRFHPGNSWTYDLPHFFSPRNRPWVTCDIRPTEDRLSWHHLPILEWRKNMEIEKKEKSQDFFWLDFETWTISPKIIKTINFTFPKNQAFLTKDTVVKDGSEHNCKCSSSRAWSSCPLRRTRNSTSRHLAKWPQGSPASDTPWPVSSQLRNHLFFKNSNYHEICITPKNSSATKKICKHIWYVFCSFCHPSSMKKVLLGPFTPHLAASFSPYCSQSLVFLKFFKGPKIRKKKNKGLGLAEKGFLRMFFFPKMIRQWFV